MTTIICRILNGGTDPQLGSSVTNTFSDTVSHWASGYIEFCVTRGIVAGRGDGTFDPDGTVTVAEGAKMMLVALGYNASVEGLTGSNWQINTDVLANQKGLYEGMEMANTSENLSRDNAAQMGYNLLDLNMISYDYIISTDGNVVSTTPQVNDDNDTVLEELFNAVRVEGVVTGNEMAVLTSSGSGSHLDAERTRITVTNYGTGDGEQDVFSGTLTLASSTGLDELGHSVYAFVNASSSTTRATVIGSVIDSEDNTVVTDYSGDTIAAVADDNNLNLVSGTQTALNYADVDDYDASVTGNGVRGVEKILIDNDGDSDLDYVLLNTYRFGRVTSYSTSGDGSITVRCGSGYEFTADDSADVVGFDNVARDDYVLTASIGGRVHVELAESVTGTLDGYRQGEDTDGVLGNAGTNYTNRLSVDGTNYNVAWLVGYTGGDDEIQPAYSYGANSLETEATFYLGKGDYIIAVGNVSENAYNYALVLAADGQGVTDQVRVALSDGTKGTYTVNSNGDTFHSTAPLGDTSDEYFRIGSLCTYSLSGDTIRLTEVDFSDDFEGTANTNFSNGRTAITDGTNTVYASAGTAFFYVGLDYDTDGTPGNGDEWNAESIGSGDVDVYAGYANAPSVENATSYVHLNSEGRAVAVIFVGDNITTANVDNFLYIYGRGNSNNDYTQVDAFVAGSNEAEENLQAVGAVDSEGVRLWTTTSEGYYDLDVPDDYDGTDGNLITGNVVDSDADTWTVSSTNANTFVIANGTGDGATSYELEFNSETLLVNDSSNLSSPVAEMGNAPSVGDNIAYILFTLDSDDQPDVAKLVVIKNSSSSSNNNNNNNNNTTFNGTTVIDIDSSTDTITVKYHSDTDTVSASTLMSLIRAADSTVATIDTSNYNANGGGSGISGSVDITNTSGDTYTMTIAAERYFEVSYNGVSQGYLTSSESMDIAVTSGATGVLDVTNSRIGASLYATVSSNQITVTESGWSADVDLWDAYQIATQTGLTNVTATFGTSTSALGGSADITAGTTWVARGTTVYVQGTNGWNLDSKLSGWATVTPAEAGTAGVYSFEMPVGGVGATALSESAVV